MCSLERTGEVYVLRLKGDVDEHRLNPAFCEEIIASLEIVNRSDAGALVTTNEGKFFSNGLDLAWRDQDPSTRSQLQRDAFNKLLEAFMRVNVPTVAAIRGHAAAGGFIVALAHDHRHMYQERGFLYMSELDVSILIPPKVMALIRSKLSPRAFKEVVLKAAKFTANAAKELGIVDGAHPTAEGTLEAAVAEATQLASRKWRKDLYVGTRLTMYPEVVAGFAAKL